MLIYNVFSDGITIHRKVSSNFTLDLLLSKIIGVKGIYFLNIYLNSQKN